MLWGGEEGSGFLGSGHCFYVCSLPYPPTPGLTIHYDLPPLILFKSFLNPPYIPVGNGKGELLPGKSEVEPRHPELMI